MCVIIYHQRKHKTIPLENLQNAIHNNPHGIGLVRFGEKGKLLVSKHLPKDLASGPNAEALHKELVKLENHSYILHLRNTTAGENTKENLHPFELYRGKDAHYVMMHNGTLQEFNEKDSKESDTFRFVEQIARPLAHLHVTANKGKCITSSPFAMNIFEKFRSATSRFIIISGDRRVHRLGTWHEKEWGTCSNDDYFYRVTRGPHQKKTESWRTSGNGVSQTSNRVVPALIGTDIAFWKNDWWSGPLPETIIHQSSESFFQ